jgi:dimethylhistidine N-methyltransferase
MTVSAKARLSPFALDVAEGLSLRDQKKLAPRWFYDDLGSKLFEAITLLPEYGLTRADERLLRTYAADLASLTNSVDLVVELGSGNGRKTRYVLEAITRERPSLQYRPIDVSAAALAYCEKELGDIAAVRPVTADWLQGLHDVARSRRPEQRLLLLFLGSSIGNVDRDAIPGFLKNIRARLEPGDFFLLGADLMRDPATLLAAYDDPLGITGAFNLNVLRRMNNELGADFDLQSFAHTARWNAGCRRIEMHLLCYRDCIVNIETLGSSFEFRAGETIWTESSHKFTVEELESFALDCGFNPVITWIDTEWPFAETLWSV